MTGSVNWKVMGLVLGLAPLADHALAASPFDGIYVGTQRETLNNNSAQCANINKDNARLTVKDGIIRYSWAVPIETTVGSDGSFGIDQQGQSYGRGGTNQLAFKGKISGGNLEADVGTSHCAAHLSFKKI